jgi:hypothetical protein
LTLKKDLQHGHLVRGGACVAEEEGRENNGGTEHLEETKTGLKLVWNRFGIGLGLVWDRFGTGLEPVWNWSTGLEPVWNRFGTSLELVWNRFGTCQPVWNQFGTSLEPVWNQFGTGLELVRNRFGTDFAKFLFILMFRVSALIWSGINLLKLFLD